jgi:hypothetical protein
MIDYPCGKCNTVIHSPESEAGKQLQCPQCKGTVIVPAAPGPKKGVIVGVVALLSMILFGCPLLIIIGLAAISVMGQRASGTFTSVGHTIGGS